MKNRRTIEEILANAATEILTEGIPDYIEKEIERRVREERAGALASVLSEISGLGTVEGVGSSAFKAGYRAALEKLSGAVVKLAQA